MYINVAVTSFQKEIISLKSTMENSLQPRSMDERSLGFLNLKIVIFKMLLSKIPITAIRDYTLSANYDHNKT